MRQLAPLLAFAVGYLLGPTWLAAMRRKYRRQARRFDTFERTALGGQVPDELLDRTWVAVVPAITLAWCGMVPRRWRPRADTAAGFCAGSVVLIRADMAGSDRLHSVLFHELVHTAQMRVTGPRRFCGRYLRECVEVGYSAISFEVEAYELQGRFDDGHRFDLDVAVRKR